jgi:hypothetical protein
MAIVTNRGISKIPQQALVEEWVQNAIICMSIILTWQWLNFFLVRISYGKNRLLRLYFKYMIWLLSEERSLILCHGLAIAYPSAIWLLSTDIFHIAFVNVPQFIIDVCVVPPPYQWPAFGYFAGLYHSGEAYLLMFMLFISLLCDL